MLEVFEKLQEQVKDNKPTVLVTIIDMKGSAPGKTGFKMLVGKQGRIYGTIGGGGVEFYAINKCSELIGSDKKNLTQTIVLKENKTVVELPGQNKMVPEENGKIRIEALCGGEVTLFYEVFRPINNLYIFGAGHVGQAVCSIARTLKFNISLIDFREEILNEIPKNKFDKMILVDFSKLVSMNKDDMILDENGFVLIMTHNHLHDQEVLKFIFRCYPNMKYIGMIGSGRKVHESILVLRQEFGNDIKLNNLYAPVGLDLGGDLPEEIALSIIAEIESIIHNRLQNHLRLDILK